MSITYERKIEVIDEDTGMAYWKHDDVTDLVNALLKSSNFIVDQYPAWASNVRGGSSLLESIVAFDVKTD